MNLMEEAHVFWCRLIVLYPDPSLARQLVLWIRYILVRIRICGLVFLLIMYF
jgi:hypothetical protein